MPLLSNLALNQIDDAFKYRTKMQYNQRKYQRIPLGVHTKRKADKCQRLHTYLA